MASREIEFIDKVFNELGFQMMYPPKVDRAVFGSATSDGYVGGVGIGADAKTILAKYDELAGYITKDGYPVKPGCFYDRQNKKIIENPDVVLLIKVNGEVVEHREGEEETLELKVAKKQIQRKGPGRPKKVEEEKTLDA